MGAAVGRAVMALALLVAACSGPVAPSGGGSSPAADASPGATASPSAGASPSGGDRVIGRIVAIDPGDPSITLDLVEWFDGPDAANRAALEDGALPPSNPFYVRDLHRRRTIALDPAAAVTVLGYDAEGNTEPTPVPLPEFVRLWRAGPASGDWTPAVYYWCSIRDGRVVGIEAQYVP